VSSKKLIRDEFEEKLIREYFACGSINKVFQKHHYNLPISFAGYDRVLTKYGVVKSAGPNSKLSESLFLMSLLADYKISLEKIYHRFAPKTFQVSSNTLHRILHYTRLGLTRRQGVALLIVTKDKPTKVLMGNDFSLRDKKLGNKGDLSLPMGYSKLGEPAKDSIARVLQNEVFTNRVVARKFPWKVIPDHNKPVMYVNIADICVSVYKLEIPTNLVDFSSLKLRNIRFREISEIDKYSLRAGVEDIVKTYENLGKSEQSAEALVVNSKLNSSIFALARDPAE